MMRTAIVLALAWVLSPMVMAQTQSSQVESKQTDTKQQTTPKTGSTKPAGNSPAGDSGEPLYVVKDGNKVDAKTYDGWRTWRALACERCHGANQEGLVGPSLLDRLKVITKQDFYRQVMEGNVEKGMPPFSSSKMVQENWEGMYAYLKGRSDGKINPGRLQSLTPQK